MSLKTDYQNDKYNGKRRYLLEANGDGTYSIVDTTEYAVTGDIFNADDINNTNKAVNELSKTLELGLEKTNEKVNSIDSELTNVQPVSFPMSGWSNSAPYIQQVPIYGMKESHSPTPGIIYPEGLTEERKNNIDKSSDMITEIESLDGYLKATCKFKKPVADLIIGLKGR